MMYNLHTDASQLLCLASMRTRTLYYSASSSIYKYKKYTEILAKKMKRMALQLGTR